MVRVLKMWTRVGLAYTVRPEYYIAEYIYYLVMLRQTKLGHKYCNFSTDKCQMKMKDQRVDFPAVFKECAILVMFTDVPNFITMSLLVNLKPFTEDNLTNCSRHNSRTQAQR